MSLKSLIPYYGDRKVREQIDRIFSREVLGAVVVGKFLGDYLAILSTRTLGKDLGYSIGIVVSVCLFIYWHKLENVAGSAKDKAEEVKDNAK